jgi:predicted alpha-1,2-mannosidase
MVKQATEANPMRPALQQYMQYGYIPADNKCDNWLPTEPPFCWGSVSTTLEYALADWHIAELAKALGKTADEATFRARSKAAYTKLWDASTGFLRPRNADGSWLTPFDPLTKDDPAVWPGGGGPGYVEGNAWQYRFFVPQDVLGLRDAMGGDPQFVAALQATFDEGQFDLTNEPDMAFPYLFTYIPGEEWRTQQIVRDSLATKFTNGSMGIPGNDDTGALSAYYVFGAMGFYPDNPGSLRYSLGSPVFDTITIHLSDGGLYPGGSFTIVAHDNGPDNVYVQSSTLRGEPYSKPYLMHSDITNGGTFELSMGATHP